MLIHYPWISTWFSKMQLNIVKTAYNLYQSSVTIFCPTKNVLGPTFSEYLHLVTMKICYIPEYILDSYITVQHLNLPMLQWDRSIAIICDCMSEQKPAMFPYKLKFILLSVYTK